MKTNRTFLQRYHRFGIIFLLCFTSILSWSQASEDCTTAIANSVNISALPYEETITIDPSWTMDTDYLPTGLSGTNSTAYWAFTINNTSNYSFSFSSSGANAINDNISIGFAESCPLSNANEIYFGPLSTSDITFDCNSLTSSQTYILVFAVDQGTEGEISITISDPSPSNDECTNALDITPPFTCDWWGVDVNNQNACPEDFNIVGGCNFDEDPTVWYSFTAPAIQEDLILEIQNISDFNSYIAVFESTTDCGENIVTILGQECIMGIGPHTFFDPLIPGATYLIAFANPIPGDYFFEIRINALPENDDCFNAEPLIANTITEGTTICATQEIAPYNSNVCSDFDEMNTVWYQCTVPNEEKGFYLTITGSALNPIFGDINVVVFDGFDCNPNTVEGEVCTQTAQLIDEFECIGPGDYSIRVSTADIWAGDFDILLEPLFSEQINNSCTDAEMTSFNPPLENMWMPATANTIGACPEEIFLPDLCQTFQIYPTVWYEINSPATATSLDLRSISSANGSPSFALLESTINCDNLLLVPGTICYEGIFNSLEDLGESLITVNPSTTYLIAVTANTLDGSNLIDFEIKWITPGGCPNGETPGDSCDDSDDCTINDMIDADCNCIGTFQDSDGDGTCDAEDVCPDGPEPGTVCDDTDDCTINDVIDADCNCVGEFQDSDGDGTCDAEDVCPDGLEPESACDDGDICTINDTVNEDCECVGIFQDSDGDGTCDAEDVCEDGPEPGTPCDDGDLCTEEDTINDDCLCQGTYVDSDNDGTCDAEDVCPDGPEPGAQCDDGDICTIDDMVNEDCICIGTFIDTDEDGTCDAEDVCENGPEPGTPCDDENDCTIDDVINEDCFCVGTFVDSDFDGTCDAEDVCPGGPEPGTPCDDDDDCTIDDQINEDCECLGTFQDSDEDGVCDAEDICEDGPEPGTPCNDGNESTFNDQINLDCICVGSMDSLYCPGLDLNIGDMCDDGDECTINDTVDEDCNCVGEFLDSDNDGTCDANDLCPDVPEPGTPCDDNDDTTIDDQINSDCECMGIIDPNYCSEIELYIGDECDDGDECTIDDTIDDACNCTGIFQDSDNDGICDADDLCPDGPEPGTPCDDMNPDTSNDQINMDCTCEGSMDSIFCETLDLFVGDPCDDDDDCTIDDVVDEDCNCIGVFLDSDNDGTCDADDQCPDGPEPGTPCDDMNPDTVNDQIGENCNCSGVILPGYCPELNLFVGDPCNDGDLCTIEDVVTEDCECAGEFNDSDQDGVCNAEDNCPGVANEDQADNDGDEIGDVCDADDDNDGILDEEDNCPFDSNEDQADEDMDGIGDVCDVVNTYETTFEKVILYPNPSLGTLYIEKYKDIAYRIFTIQGELVLQSRSMGSQLNIEALQPGLYFIEFLESNTSLGFTKLVKI